MWTLLHFVGHWLYNNSPTVQAVCAIFALLGLAIYAWDTRQIRQATLAQSEASRRPFFELRHSLPKGASLQTEPIYWFKNTGVGIAVDVGWKPLWFHLERKTDNAQLRPLGAAPPGSKLRIHVDNVDLTYSMIKDFGGIAVTYADTAGKPYFTLFMLRTDGSIRLVTLSERLKQESKYTNAGLRKGTDTTWADRFLK